MKRYMVSYERTALPPFLSLSLPAIYSGLHPSRKRARTYAYNLEFPSGSLSPAKCLRLLAFASTAIATLRSFYTC